MDTTEIINSKTAGGLIEFCGFLADKGLAPGKSMENWKGAARNVFGALEGEDWEQFSLDGLDIDEYLARFETLRRGQYKPESLAAYASRFRASVEGYLAFVKDGTTPILKPRKTRRSAPAAGASPAVSPAPSSPAAPLVAATVDNLIEFPFPLQSGEMATFRLPKRLEKDDAVRINLFLKSLEAEPQAQIPEHTGDEERIAA